MKKIKKIDLSGVEHLDDAAAKEYVSMSSSPDNIQTDAEGKSGSDSDSSSAYDPIIDPACQGKSEGDACYNDGQPGNCDYRKVTEWVWDGLGSGFKTRVKLMCIDSLNQDSGNKLTPREYECLGKEIKADCVWYDKDGRRQTGDCQPQSLYGTGGPLFCAGVSTTKDKTIDPES